MTILWVPFHLACIVSSTALTFVFHLLLHLYTATQALYHFGLRGRWMQTRSSRRSGWKGGLGVSIWLRSCPCQHLHGTLRTVSAEIASYLSQYIFRRDTYIWSSLFFNLTAATTTTFTVHRGLSSPSRRAIILSQKLWGGWKTVWCRNIKFQDS